MKKRMVCLAATGIFTLAMAMTAMAGTWKEDATGKWYDNGDGTWPANVWQWIDSDADGVSECYYFDANGYAKTSVTVEGGYTVNEKGQWTLNAAVQTKGEKTAATGESAAAEETKAADAAETKAADTAETTAAGEATTETAEAEVEDLTVDKDAKVVSGNEKWAHWIYKGFEEQKVLNTGRGRFLYPYPDATSKIITTIPRGAENVMMIGEYWKDEKNYAGWTKVNFDGKIGYIEG